MVGQGDAAEREEEVGAVTGGGGPAVGGADGEDEALGAAVAEGAEAGGEVLGGEELAAGVEEDEVGGGAGGSGVEGCEEGVFGSVYVLLSRQIAVGAGGVFGDEAGGGFFGRAGFGAGGFGKDSGEENVHGRCPVTLYRFTWNVLPFFIDTGLTVVGVNTNR